MGLVTVDDQDNNQDQNGQQNEQKPSPKPAPIKTVPAKRHRVRSRSMPNLVYYEPKAHKVIKQHHRSAPSVAAAVNMDSGSVLNPKYMTSIPFSSTSKTPITASSCPTDTTDPADSASSADTPTLSSSSSPSSSTTSTSSTTSSSSTTSLSKSRKPLPVPSASCPNAPVQLPPVNCHSLREIDLQEIFKNPQLRHDIIFDPQLQFRPNLDGERGKRKRVVAEKYWNAIVTEFEHLDRGNSLSSMSRLPLMFHTLRDILLSLLPLKDRAHVDSILDPDLVMQQIRHGALDFVSMARWLAEVFKAHCAPMRDAWVDQMVCRIELGVETQSPRRLVEGLRMVFAILEAMKLDVANHQIRTLRPMLVDTAIEFEQDYYTQVVDKGKLSLADSLDWFKRSLESFESANPQSTYDANRAGFVWGLLRLFSCSLDSHIVTEFPSTFGFDFSRLAGFRAELRKVVCLHLCVLLYQQMCSTQGASAAATLLAKDKVEKLKTDLLAIIEDSMGNSKWTKNTHALALEIARRASGAKDLAPSKMVDIASGWLSKHLQPRSEVYKMVEQKTCNALLELLMSSWSVLSSLDCTSTVTSHYNNNSEAIPSSIATSSVLKETMALANRVLVLVRFHWGVFGKFYATYVSMGEAARASTMDIDSPANLLNGGLSSHVHSAPQDEQDRRLSEGRIRQSSTSAC